MSSDTRTARARFVEAMKYLSVEYRNHHEAFMRQAIDAFADAECGHREIDIEDAFKPGGHVACRAALRKECGL